MGKYDNMIYRYLSDTRRFADLFNGIWFRGRGVIHPEDLQEGSEKYTEEQNKSHFRDLKKRFVDGRTLRILAVENQNLTDYTMPIRCMNYDVQEYRRQVAALCSKNWAQDSLATPAERFCGLKKSDRLAPVYTICLYHGEDDWDGPRSLKDAGGRVFAAHGGRAPIIIRILPVVRFSVVFPDDDWFLWQTVGARWHLTRCCRV